MPSQTNETDQFDVFISYAMEDVEHARQLVAALEPHGYHCFVAGDNLDAVVGTDEWSEALEGVLASVPVLLLLVTQHALESKWVTFEWRAFHKALLGNSRAGMIVPVLWDELEIESLPLALRSCLTVDVARLGEEQGMDKLLELVDGFRGAALRSKDPLERALKWTHQPSNEPPQVTAPPVSGFTLRSLVPRIYRNRWRQTLGWAAALMLGTAWLVHANRWPDSACSLGAARSTLDAGSTVPSRSLPTSDPSREPRRGWEPIEAYLHPTLENQNFVTRAETWRESESAFDTTCQSQCTSRQRAAGLLAAGQCAWLEGKVDTARRAFEQALDTDRDWALPLAALASTWVMEKPESAIDYARRAYERDRSVWIAMLAKASAFVQRLEYVAAVQEYKEARARAPEDCYPLVDALMALTYHAEGRREEKAAEMATAACTDQIHWASACVVLAERALEQNNPDQALTYVELADRDDFVPLLLAQGDAFQLKKKLDRAWAAWRRAAQLKDRARAQGTVMSRLALVVAAVASGMPPPSRIALPRTQPAAAPRSAPESRSEPPSATPAPSPPRSRPASPGVHLAE